MATRRLFGTILVLGVVLVGENLSGRPRAVGNDHGPDKVSIIGRTLARVDYLTGYPENLLSGQHYDVFVFGVVGGSSTQAHIVPVKVMYEFWRDEHPLPNKFFDFSRLYELHVIREKECDETVKSLSYARITEGGKPAGPMYVLTVLDGAPPDLLQPNAMLPCYLLRPSQYKRLKADR